MWKSNIAYEKGWAHILNEGEPHYKDETGAKVTWWEKLEGYENSKCREVDAAKAADGRDEEKGSGMSTGILDFLGWGNSAAPLATCGVAVIAAVSAALF